MSHYPTGSRRPSTYGLGPGLGLDRTPSPVPVDSGLDYTRRTRGQSSTTAPSPSSVTRAPSGASIPGRGGLEGVPQRESPVGRRARGPGPQTEGSVHGPYVTGSECRDSREVGDFTLPAPTTGAGAPWRGGIVQRRTCRPPPPRERPGLRPPRSEPARGGTPDPDSVPTSTTTPVTGWVPRLGHGHDTGPVTRSEERKIPDDQTGVVTCHRDLTPTVSDVGGSQLGTDRGTTTHWTTDTRGTGQTTGRASYS